MGLDPVKFVRTSGEDAEGQTRRGRKPMKFLDSEFVPTLIGYLEEGLGFKAACDLCGVSSTSVRKYIREGLQDLEAGRESTLADFAYQATAAMAEAKRTRINQLNKAAAIPAFWAAAAWWLERTEPQEYGRQDRLAMTFQNSDNLSEKLAKVSLSDEEAEAIGAVLGRIDSLGDEERTSDAEPFGFSQSS
jgi:hypothetical protein